MQDDILLSFTKIIVTQNGFGGEFFFHGMHTGGGIRYHISVIDKDGGLCHLTMAERNKKWKIINAPYPPEWIIDVETELENAILQSIF